MTPDSSKVVIGLDLGTSGLKAVATSVSGDVVARASASYPTMRPEPQASEQDPESWLIAVRSAVRELSDVVPADRWLGIGLSAMIPTLVTVDDSGKPVGTAITWEDGRAESQATALNADVGSEQLYSVTGQVLDGRYLLPMLLRLKDAEPDRFARTSKILGAKDYLFWWLTGHSATDPSTASGYGCYDLSTGEWRSDILAAADKILDAPIPELPTVRPSAHAVPLTDETARHLGLTAGLPIVLGAADSVLAALALGVSKPGDVAYVAGTSTVILAVSDQLVLDPAHRYLVTPMSESSSWGLEMDLLATGSAVRWLAELVGVTESELMELGGAQDLDAAPTFLPYVAPGEQGALWEPLLTGTISGLTIQHGRADVARALLTGLVLESRRCLNVIAEVTGIRGAILVAGSSASSPAFHRDLADATGQRVVACTSAADHSAVGAALVAAAALGVRSASEGVSISSQAVVPDLRLTPKWDQLARRHDVVLAGVRGL